MPKDYHLHDRLGFKLTRLSRLMQGRLEAGLAEHDLTRLKWCILSGVGIEGHNAPSELADHIGITRPAISRLLKAMIKDGLIERSLVEDDGRSRQISVTALGSKKLDACWPMVEANQEHFLNKLSEAQKDALNDALRDMIAGEADMLEDL
ncbi:MarR family winged helix-turn-helix transcriptional regulator [Yoonia sp. SS1-5]|uniref:MarR family winged helix-turn-helix transcriptional regulator n=1 Tax=Yoonia rhodophyticola TaxID=3137370 RepID=A0AAN0MIC8_9RHOB